jgi:hypothetical protein
MNWDWLNKIVRKVAAEVHKTKIDEFEKRIQEMEQKQEVILKTIIDNQNKLDKLDDRLYQANMESAAAVGAIKTIIQTNSNNIINSREQQV